jgi:hypothetical protein
MRLTSARGGGSAVSGRLRLSTRWVIALVAASLVITFTLDRTTDAAPVQHLYYLPIILAASRLRWVGGLTTSLIAIVLYHLANRALLRFAYRETDFVQIALFIAVGGRNQSHSAVVDTSSDRRLDQAAGAADAPRKPRSIGGVAWGSQEVSCDPLSPDHAGGAPAS